MTCRHRSSTLISTVNDKPRHNPEIEGDGRAKRARAVLSAFLGSQASMEEVRAMLRAWIDDVRGHDMQPEQALKEFKTMLPLRSTFRDDPSAELGGRSAAELVSIFIEEYYRGERDGGSPDES